MKNIFVWYLEQAPKSRTGIITIVNLGYHYLSAAVNEFELGKRVHSAIMAENSSLRVNREQAILSRAMEAHHFTFLEAIGA